MKRQMMLKSHLSQHPSPKKKKSKGGILITIQTTDGLFVKKGGLDYAGMKDLVSRLEGLC